MTTKSPVSALLLSAIACGLAGGAAVSTSLAQENPPPPASSDQRPAPQGGRGGPGGFGRGGFGGFGGMPQTVQLVPQFDKDGDKRLNSAERKAAREFLQSQRGGGRGGSGRGGMPNFGPGTMLAPQMIAQGDKNADQKLSRDEFAALAETWFNQLDADANGKLNQERFTEEFAKILPAPQGFGGRRGNASDGEPPRQGGPNRDRPSADAPQPGQEPSPGAGRGGGRGGFGRGGFNPAGPLASGLFAASDTDKDGSLTRSELKATFEKWHADWDSAKSGSLDEAKLRDGLNASLARPNPGGPGGGFPGFGGRGGGAPQPPQPGPKLTPAEVKSFPEASLYDSKIVRTFFLEFENADWERELSDFYHSDVDVPAKLTVDGKTYREIGVRFRGTSSYMQAGEGRKRSFNLSLDFVDDAQHLGGYRTINLLNSASDPTFLRTLLYTHIARQLIPAPKVNFVRVVINGESWGIYVNSQQFNKEFMKEFFGTTKTARWKAEGNQRGTSRFNYLGEDAAEYKRVYAIKSKDDPKAWADLIKLCRTLHESPPEQLEQALSPLLDIDGILKFLALDNTLINSDGYWVRTGDWNICQDEKGRFHIVPHDANETFGPPNGPGFGQGGFGFGGGPASSSVHLDPLSGIDDPDKPLVHKLLSVPSLRTRYLGYVRAIAEEWLDWNKLGPLAEQYQALIVEDVRADTRKLYPTEAFAKGLTDDFEESGFRGGSARIMSLKSFAEKRRAYLLKYDETKKTAAN